MFTPDGRSLVFYSNREGNWAAWTIGIDGGGLRKISGPPEGSNFPNVSPKGDLVVFSGASSDVVQTAPLASTPSVATKLPGVKVGDKFFSPTGWSADGARLAGYMTTATRPSGVGVYDFATHTTTVVSEDEVFAVKWLADSRRVAYFTKGGWELVVLDTVTRQRTVVDVRLPGPAANEMFAISADNRTIYYGAARTEADIWMVERK